MPEYSVAEEIELLADAGLLTERQAEAFVRRRVEGEPGWSVAEDMSISQSTVADYVGDAEQKIERAQATVGALEAIRYQAPDA
jgi:DNA-directed RNA polymerase specialized sigma24 family protein